MTSIPVRLYGPGLPPAGQDAQLRAGATGLRLVAPEMDVPGYGVVLRRCGFDEQGLELSWRDGSDHWALQVLDRTQASALLAALPPGLQAARGALLADTRRVGRGRRLGWLALGLILGAPLLLLLAFLAFADPLAGAVAERIPLAQERRLGEASFASMKPTLKLRDEGEAARVVREIGARLTAGSRYRYEFHVVDNPQVNAFAMPGGIVVVHSGLIAATRRPEELAGVLAHEVQHVELRHSLKGVVKQLGLGALWALATGDVGSGLAGQAAQKMLDLRFSREAEEQADARGLEALRGAAIDPTGMAAFFRTLEAQGATPPALLSTHPASAERQRALETMLRERPPAPVPPLPYAPWPPAL